MQLNVDLELTNFTNRAVRHAHFGFGGGVTGISQRIGYIACADRAEQLAFVTGIGGDGDADSSQCSSALFCFCLFGGCSGF